MSVSLQPLQTLVDIANTTPKGKSPLVTEVTDQLKSVTSSLFVANTQAAIDDTGSIFDDIIGAITKAINDAINGVKNLVNSVGTTITNTVNNQVKNLMTAVTGIATQITNKIDSAIGGLESAINDAIGWIAEKLQGLIDAVSDIAATIGNAIADAISNIGDFIANAVNAALASVGNWIAGAIRDIGNFITGVYNAVSKWISDAVSNVGKWVKQSQDAVADYINGVINTLKQAYDTTKQYILDAINKIIAFVNQTGQVISKWFWQTVSSGAKWFADNVMPKFNDAVIGAQDIVELGKGIWGYLQDGNFQGAFDLLDKFTSGLGIPAPVKSLWSIVSAIAYFWETVRIQFVPMEVSAAKHANIDLALDPTSLDAAAVAVIRGKLSLDGYYANAKLAGVTKDRANINLEANKQLPTPGAIQDAFLRGTIDEKTHDNLLHSWGYSDDHISLFRALYHLIPSPTDLIRMGVREAFTPEIAEKFGQYEDFPQAFGDWAAKVGIDIDWAKRYWAAHWDLPSATMGFEMLHRGVIDDNELKLLLRALDVMPYWREKIIAISYNPLTRVDIRRMYQNGVLDLDQVKRAYLDIGYNDEKANWLTDFTKRYYTPEDQTQLDQFHDLARATYSQAYKRKIISRDEYYTFLEGLKYYKDDIELLITLDDYAIADQDKLFDLTDYKKSYKKLALNAYDDGLISKDDIGMILSDLGYENDEVSLELALSEYNRSLSLRNLLISQLHDQYVTYIIDNVQLSEVMGMYNFTSQEVDSLLEVWNIERSFRTKRPSLADLRKFLDRGLITLDNFLDELRGSGYNEKYISLYQAMLITPTG